MDSLQKRRRMLAIRSKSSGGSSSSFSPRRPSKPTSPKPDPPPPPSSHHNIGSGVDVTSKVSQERDLDEVPISSSPVSIKKQNSKSDEVSKILFDSSSDEEEEEPVVEESVEEPVVNVEEEESEDSDDRDWKEMMKKPELTTEPSPPLSEVEEVEKETETEKEVDDSLPQLNPEAETTSPTKTTATKDSDAHDVQFPAQTNSLLTLLSHSGFLLGTLFGSLLTLLLLFTFYPLPHNYSLKGCALPFRAWHVKLSRVDVLVELTAHSTHIHLPFMSYILTHDIWLTISLILLCEVAEWINNALKIAEFHMYDDPLDDFLQGLIGLIWAAAFVKVHEWNSIEKETDQRYSLYGYGTFYCIICSILMGSAWYLPRRLGLAVYTIWASLGIRYLRRFNIYQADVLSFITCLYGILMLMTEDMISQNTGLAFFFASTVAIGSFMKSDKNRTRAIKIMNISLYISWTFLIIFIILSGLIFVGRELETSSTCPSNNVWCKVTESIQNLFQDKGEAFAGMGDVYLKPIGIFGLGNQTETVVDTMKSSPK